MKEKEEKRKGITLIALVITIVVLLILAGITINMLFSDNGVIKRANKANAEYSISQAKEKLILVLTGAQIEKNTNRQYNEQDYLDEYILTKIEESEIIGDIVIVDGYAFSLDRSVPKIGEYIGKEEELIFPEATVESELAGDFKTATIHISAKEQTNGIAKIEVILNGFVLKEYTYENRKDEIKEDYVVKQNGKYNIKVYSKLNVTKKINIDGLVSTIEYSPNGNTTYQREHQVKIQVKEDVDKVKSIKYQWLQTTAEPTKESFSEACRNQETITKNGLTGQWYLWTLLETESGKENIGRSEVFYFDNEGPDTTLTTNAVSETAFDLVVTATDNETQVEKYEFYVNNQLKETITSKETTVSYPVTNVTMGNYDCYVITTDSLGNTTKKSIMGKTKIYTWERWSVTEIITSYTASVGKFVKNCMFATYDENIKTANFNSSTGVFQRDIIPYWHTSGYLYFNSSLYYSCHYCRTGASACEQKTYTNLYNVVVNKNSSYSKGQTQYSDVTNINSSTYPTNGMDGSYWYVYKGLI